MTIARHNLMIAKDGKAEKLCEALRALVAKSRTLQGFAGAVLLRVGERPDHVIFVERWSSMDLYADSRTVLDVEDLPAAMALLTAAPTSAYVEYVQI